MTIYETLKKDHDGLKPLLAQLVEQEHGGKSPTALIEKIRDELIPHSRAEEAVFYNSLRTIDGAGELVTHGYMEHMQAEAMLRTLQAIDLVDVKWVSLAQKFKDGIEHHIEEEEGDIFSAARLVLVNEEAEMMAVAFEELKPQIREGSMIQTTMDLIANLMPNRFAAPLRTFVYGK